MFGGLLFGVALACGGETSQRASANDSATASSFAPFDSVTLEARCQHRVTPAEDTTYRQAVSRVAGTPGVLVYAAPDPPRRPCYQLGVVSPTVRDSIATVLQQAGVPPHVVTYFQLTEIPPDDIQQSAAAPGERPR